MKNKKQLEDALEALEFAIKGFRQSLRANLPFSQLAETFKSQLEKILNLFSDLEQDQELEQKRKVYSNIARFIQEKVDNFQNDLNTCLSAVYFLCKESDPQLLIESTPSTQTQRIIDVARKEIIAIKAQYEQVRESNACKIKTEIFSIKPNENNPKITTIEEAISWDSLPLEVRESFIRDGKDKVCFQIYP